ncbi:unnamed protein product [Caenorhabditis brenneri]
MPEEPAIHRFPLLRLPYLCIEAIVLNSDVCIDYLDINADYLSDFLDAGFSFNKVKKLAISGKKEIENDKLKYLVEWFEVSEAFILMCPVFNSFYCNPKLFDAKTLMLVEGKSAGWITGNYLSQLGNIRILDIDFPQFGMKDFVEFITGWFQSAEKTNLKSFVTSFKNPFPPQDLVLDHLQPMPWDPERRPAGVL